MKTLASTFAEIAEIRAVITLAGQEIQATALGRLSQANVSVETWVDQWRILEEADVFITHHGMNSTHEAIFQQIPMVSYPFFWDQPGLAEKCQQLGLAIPLAGSPQGSFGKDDVSAALTRLGREKKSMRTALALARDWELAVIESRPAVLQRVLDLMA